MAIKKEETQIEQEESRQTEVIAEKKIAPVDKEQSKQPRMIYVGPNLGNGRLAQYTVFKEGIPKHLDDVVQKYPLIIELFVPISKLAYVQARISSVGTLEQQAYQSIGKGGN